MGCEIATVDGQTVYLNKDCFPAIEWNEPIITPQGLIYPPSSNPTSAPVSTPERKIKTAGGGGGKETTSGDASQLGANPIDYPASPPAESTFGGSNLFAYLVLGTAAFILIKGVR